MNLPRSIRTDLVVSMTLAELFLMLLFVVWYAFTPERDEMEAEKARLVDEVVSLRRELHDAQEKNDKARLKIEDLEGRLRWWRSVHPEEVKNEKPIPENAQPRPVDKV